MPTEHELTSHVADKETLVIKCHCTLRKNGELPNNLAEAMDNYLAKEGCLERPLLLTNREELSTLCIYPGTPEHHQERFNRRNTVYLMSNFFPATSEEYPMNNTDLHCILFWKMCNGKEMHQLLNGTVASLPRPSGFGRVSAAPCREQGQLESLMRKRSRLTYPQKEVYNKGDCNRPTAVCTMKWRYMLHVCQWAHLLQPSLGAMNSNFWAASK